MGEGVFPNINTLNYYLTKLNALVEAKNEHDPETNRVGKSLEISSRIEPRQKDIHFTKFTLNARAWSKLCNV